MNVINYQKELDKTIVSLQKEGRVKNFCCTAAVRLQQLCIGVLVRSILKSRYFIIIRTFIRKVNIQNGFLRQQELISGMNLKHPVCFLAEIMTGSLHRMAEGMEDVKEGGRQML